MYVRPRGRSISLQSFDLIIWLQAHTQPFGASSFERPINGDIGRQPVHIRRRHFQSATMKKGMQRAKQVSFPLHSLHNNLILISGKSPAELIWVIEWYHYVRTSQPAKIERANWNLII